MNAHHMYMKRKRHIDILVHNLHMKSKRHIDILVHNLPFEQGQTHHIYA